MSRCQFVRSGHRCVRAEHPDDVHVFGGPAVIPPMWWTQEEARQFYAGRREMELNGVIPATA